MSRAATLRIVRGWRSSESVVTGALDMGLGCPVDVRSETMLRRVAGTLDIAVTGVDVRDVRFPTSRTLAGSDAMNEAPGYSAAYVILETDQPGMAGHGMTFTIGRGTEVVVAAIHALEHLVVGRRLADV